MKVYLAGPINGCTDAECKDWREVVKEALGAQRCTDPMRRDYRGKEDANSKELVFLDKRDYRAADVLLANAPQPSWGTGMEIFDSFERGIPVITWLPPEQTNISPWLREHSTAIVRSLPEAIAKVWEFMA